MLLKSIKTLSRKCLFCYLSVMLSGCSFIPVYERPPLPTAETYPREECTQNCSNIRQLCWQDFFTDPALQQLIALGLDNNRDLRIAIGRIYEARAVYGHSWADLFPTVDGIVPGLRTRLPGDLLSSALSTFSLQRHHQHQATPQFSVPLIWLLLVLMHGSLIFGGAFEV
ncbi:hypothetical protein [Parachlamydia acanthamoebae]|uniref:hypothetical protein n=1 Tax=Parachlamydia acanthamoebae TaxID=83552 RepID=UPI001D048996|nr:hypothetical protein [Parachlamydia acanthamoebae]